MEDDWDDGAPIVHSVGIGRGGIGRGSMPNNQSSVPGFGASSVVQSTDDSGWDESCDTTAVTNGFGGSSGGYGGSSSKPFSDFPNSNNNSGFGSKSRSSGCYKCGGDGHMARDCTNSSSGGGGGGGRSCYKCGKEGHMSRDCPDGGGGGGGGSRACYKCGQEGHMSRDCPSGGGGGSGRGGGGGSRACYKCGEEGHMSRDCPSGGGGGGSRACYKCGEEGHMSRECPTGSSGGGGGGGGKGCYKCGQDGHMARDCPDADTDKDSKPREIYVPPEPSADEEVIFRSMQKGINFDKYDQIKVNCTGVDAPKSGISSFDQANLYERFLENVRKANYSKPTPVQKWAIPVIRGGRDLMACAQTGSGKTAAFLLPVLTGMMETGLQSTSLLEYQTPQAVVVAPTRELVIQIYNEARKFSHGSLLRPVVVYGGTSVGHQLKQVEAGCHIVVGTPGRLLDFIGRGKINLSKCQYLILDEADRMLDMGFEKDVRRLVNDFNMPSKTERQTLMFSATFPSEIQKLAQDFLNNYIFVTVGLVGGANTDITQTVYEVGQFDKRERLVSILNEAGTERTLVFVGQKRNADFLATYLSQSNFPTTSIHGDRLQREREEALRDFTTGRSPILIATSVAARGLDIPKVQHVVNYDLPPNIEEYVHRIGRTGRCGNTGRATSFYDPSKDSSLARDLLKALQDSLQDVPSFLEDAAMSGGDMGGRGGGSYNGFSDNRRNKFENNSGFSSFGNTGGGGGGGAAEEEEWD